MNITKEEILKLNEDASEMLDALSEAMNASWSFINSIKESLATRPSDWDQLGTAMTENDKISAAGLRYNVHDEKYFFHFNAISEYKNIELHDIDMKTIQKLFINLALAIHDGSLETEFHTITAQDNKTIYTIIAGKESTNAEKTKNPFELRVYNNKKENIEVLREERLRDFIAATMVDHIMDSYINHRTKNLESENENVYENIITINGEDLLVVFDESEKTTEPDEEILSEMRQLIFEVISGDDGGVFDFEECGISVLIFDSNALSETDEEDDDN